MIGGDTTAYCYSVLFKPSAKTGSEQNLPMNRVEAISLLT
jgi:hypothetical protein